MNTESIITEWHTLIAAYRRKLPSRAAILEAMKVNPELALDAFNAITNGVSASAHYTPPTKATMSNTNTTARDQWNTIVAELKKTLPANMATAQAVKRHPDVHAAMLREVNAR